MGSFPTADFPLHPPLPELALIGRSNVGKSSLLNALAGRRALARISQSPGKTSLCNVYRLEAAYLLDLPGYGYARVSKSARASWQALIRDLIATRTTVSGVLWLLDLRRDPSPDDLAMGDLLAARGIPVLVVFTKVDTIRRDARAARATAIAHAVGVAEDQCVMTSVRKREGIDTLRDAIDGLLTGASAPPGS